MPQTASIHLRLTNYLEQRAVYDAYNFMLGDVLNGAAVPANTTVMATAIPGYLCPSDPNPGSTENLAGGFSARVTTVNYAVNGGVNRWNCGGRTGGTAWWLGGNPYFGSLVRISAVTDGTSNTAGFSEWVKGTSGQNTPGANLVYAIAQYTNGGPQNDFNVCRAAGTPLWDFKGEYWTLQDTGRGGPYYHVMTPNQPACAVTRRLRQRRFVHRGQLVPPRRRERPAPGRLGPVRQVERQPDHLERPGDPGLRRGRQRRCVLSAVPPSSVDGPSLMDRRRDSG